MTSRTEVPGTARSNGHLEVCSDWADATSKVYWRSPGMPVWLESPFQSGVVEQNADIALTLVESWLDGDI